EWSAMAGTPNKYANPPRINEPGPVNIPVGQVVGQRWRIIKKLGAGGCGAVYMVQDVNNAETKAALKAESNFVTGGSVLKMEVEILSRLKEKDHYARLLGSGKRDRYQYMVMTLLGESLGHLFKKIHRCSISTQIRMGIHVLHGLKMVHDIGFVHRDIKPANLAIGRSGRNMHIVHILDFGLSREYVINCDGEYKMRRPRKRALFRGTTRYCSVATHDRIEQGRCDDLWSVLYVMVECRDRLPWASIRTKEEVAECKRSTPDQQLLKTCPVQMLEFASHLRTINYFHRPDYTKLYALLVEVLDELGIGMNDPWDWERKEFGKAMNTKKSTEDEDRTSDEEKSKHNFEINPEDFDVNPFNF
ncbi:hypothetical protein PFISCL1PPCAC_16589, partial [Pristionchus fissidentatus]